MEFAVPPRSLTGDAGRGLEGLLTPLSDADLTKTVKICGEAHSVMQAMHRQLAHDSYHCGQIVFLAKHLQHANWKSLSVPRGQSSAYTGRVEAGEVSQR